MKRQIEYKSSIQKQKCTLETFIKDTPLLQNIHINIFEPYAQSPTFLPHLQRLFTILRDSDLKPIEVNMKRFHMFCKECKNHDDDFKNMEFAVNNIKDYLLCEGHTEDETKYSSLFEFILSLFDHRLPFSLGQKYFVRLIRVLKKLEVMNTYNVLCMVFGHFVSVKHMN